MAHSALAAVLALSLAAPAPAALVTDAAATRGLLEVEPLAQAYPGSASRVYRVFMEVLGSAKTGGVLRVIGDRDDLPTWTAPRRVKADGRLGFRLGLGAADGGRAARSASNESRSASSLEGDSKTNTIGRAFFAFTPNSAARDWLKKVIAAFEGAAKES